MNSTHFRKLFAITERFVWGIAIIRYAKAVGCPGSVFRTMHLSQEPCAQFLKSAGISLSSYLPHKIFVTEQIKLLGH